MRMLGRDWIEERMEEVHIPAAKLTSEFDGTEITTQSNDIARLVPNQICRCFFEKNRSISNEIVLIYCRNNIDASVAIRRKVKNGFHVLRKDLAQVGRYRRYILDYFFTLVLTSLVRWRI